MLKYLLLVTLILTGCSDASKASFRAIGQKHRVTLFSGGQKVGEWVTSGMVKNEEHSDGYYFNDDRTNRLISVSGTVLIEVVE